MYKLILFRIFDDGGTVVIRIIPARFELLLWSGEE